MMSKSIFCKNLAILAIASTLTACSGVARFTVDEFGDTVNKICGAPPREEVNMAILSNEAAIKGAVKLLTEVATSANNSGCFASYTPLSCKVACGGKDTPSVTAQSTKALGCVALAQGKDKKHHPGSNRDSKKKAEEQALSKCMNETTNCKVVVSGCG